MSNDKSEVKVLLVEDDMGHVRLMMRNLARSGLRNEIVHFNSGEKVLEFLASESAGNSKYLMLLDLNMPGMNGYQVLQRLKQNGVAEQIPVIVLTTAAGEREMQRCYDLGCSAFITKPMDYEGFSRAVLQLGLFIESVKVPEFKGVYGGSDYFVCY